MGATRTLIVIESADGAATGGAGAERRRERAGSCAAVAPCKRRVWVKKTCSAWQSTLLAPTSSGAPGGGDGCALWPSAEC